MGRQCKYNITLQQDIKLFTFGYFLDGESSQMTIQHMIPQDPTPSTMLQNGYQIWHHAKDFFKNYKHYYINELEGYGFDYYSYESPPTLDKNIRWLASLNSFYPKFDLLNYVQSAQNKDNVTIKFCNNLQTRNTCEKLIWR